MKEGCLKWFDHVQRRAIIISQKCISSIVRKSELVQVDKMGKGRERHKITLLARNSKKKKITYQLRNKKYNFLQNRKQYMWLTNQFKDL